MIRRAVPAIVAALIGFSLSGCILALAVGTGAGAGYVYKDQQDKNENKSH